MGTEIFTFWPLEPEKMRSGLKVSSQNACKLFRLCKRGYQETFDVWTEESIKVCSFHRVYLLVVQICSKQKTPGSRVEGSLQHSWLLGTRLKWRLVNMCSAVNITAGFQVILVFCLVSAAQGKGQTVAIKHLLRLTLLDHYLCKTRLSAMSSKQKKWDKLGQEKKYSMRN